MLLEKKRMKAALRVAFDEGVDLAGLQEDGLAWTLFEKMLFEKFYNQTDTCAVHSVEYDRNQSHVDESNTFIVIHYLDVTTESTVAHVPSVTPANQLELVGTRVVERGPPRRDGSGATGKECRSEWAEHRTLFGQR